jgi:hypothetical protein
VRAGPRRRDIPRRDRLLGGGLVFELLDHPMAPRCYCWELDGEVTAVLHEKPVGSAQGL